MLLSLPLFFCFLTVILVLALGTIRLGYIPSYGDTADPYALGLNYISTIIVFLTLPAAFTLALWPLLTIALWVQQKTLTACYKVSYIFFGTGLAGLTVLHLFFSDYFGWVLD